MSGRQSSRYVLMKECLAAPWRRICQRKVVSLLTKMHADGATLGPIGKMTRRQGSGDDDADALKMTWYRRKKNINLLPRTLEPEAPHPVVFIEFSQGIGTYE